MQPHTLAIIITTLPAADAQRLSARLLEARLAACVQKTAITSMYRWEGEVVCEEEVRLEIKTRAAHYEAIVDLLSRVHPYSVPEIIMIPIPPAQVASAYGAWVAENTSQEES